jgi:hypothetical protein
MVRQTLEESQITNEKCAADRKLKIVVVGFILAKIAMCVIS